MLLLFVNNTAFITELGFQLEVKRKRITDYTVQFYLATLAVLYTHRTQYMVCILKCLQHLCSLMTVNAGLLQENARTYSESFKEEYEEKSMDQLRKMVCGDGGLIMNCIKYIMNQK